MVLNCPFGNGRTVRGVRVMGMMLGRLWLITLICRVQDPQTSTRQSELKRLSHADGDIDTFRVTFCTSVLPRAALLFTHH